MKLSLIALASVTALLAPASFAQSASPVTLYGGLRVAFESVQASGGTSVAVASRSRVSNQLSFLGVRGAEVINPDLSAFFQIESGIAPDTGDTTLASRNSAVGLQSNSWGKIQLGKWDTPYKSATNVVDPFTTMQLPGMIAVMSDAGNFDLRPNNTLQYWSPGMIDGALKFRFHYSANEAKTSTANPTIYGVSGVYEKAAVLDDVGLYAGYSFEEHGNRIGAEAAAPIANYKENSNAIFAKVTYRQLWVSVMVQDFKKTGQNKQKAVMLAGNYNVGNNQFKFTILRSTGGLASPLSPKSSAIGIGWYYNLSTRTTITSSYMKTTNNADTGRASFGQNKLVLGNDADASGISIGLNHTF